MRTMSLALRHELVGLGGVIERNIYLVKRYIWWDVAFFLWTVANTLTIVFIAKGIPAVGGQDRRREGDDDPAGRRRDLGLPRDHLRDPHRDGRLGALGGTIEYTFMAPLSRPVHLLRDGPLRDRLRRRARDPAVRVVARSSASHLPTRTTPPRSCC
jgi:hypothetical protein